MSDDSEAAAGARDTATSVDAPADGEPAATPDAAPDPDDEDEKLAPGLSDDGILLFFAALACLMAALTAHTTGQPDPIVVFAVLAGVPAALGFLADVLTGFVPGTGFELLVGGAALVGAMFAVPGRYYVNIATLLVAASLVLWRVVDVEFRDAER